MARFKPPLWAAYLLMAAGLLAASLYVPRDTVFGGDVIVENPGQATLAAIDQMTKLIVSLNTAMFAAAGAMTVKGKDWTSRWNSLDSLLIVLVFACGAISYFGVFLCYVRLISMTSVGAMSVVETQMLWSIRLQYWGFIAGVVLLGLVFTRILEGRIDKPS